MGRGRGGYTSIQSGYKDSGGFKVTDKGAIFVAERYIDMGYESVFRQRHDPEPSYDLTIKSSDDEIFIRNIEVKQITSLNPSKMADRLKKAFAQFKTGREDTVAVYLPNYTNNEAGKNFARSGYSEATRKGWVKGRVEVWFSDKTSIVMQ